MRGKRANKVAVQRFRAAAKFMQEQNRHAFYEEMLRALWGYMSDKFNIPVANLTKENVREELNKRGVSAEDVAELLGHHHQVRRGAVLAGRIGARMSDVYGAGRGLSFRGLEAMIKTIGAAMRTSRYFGACCVLLLESCIRCAGAGRPPFARRRDGRSADRADGWRQLAGCTIEQLWDMPPTRPISIRTIIGATDAYRSRFDPAGLCVR
ncbi:MAG: hypothetical protein ACLRSE_07760 [Alistipes finegoldii]